MSDTSAIRNALGGQTEKKGQGDNAALRSALLDYGNVLRDQIYKLPYASSPAPSAPAQQQAQTPAPTQQPAITYKPQAMPTPSQQPAPQATGNWFSDIVNNVSYNINNAQQGTAAWDLPQPIEQGVGAAYGLGASALEGVGNVGEGINNLPIVGGWLEQAGKDIGGAINGYNEQIVTPTAGLGEALTQPLDRIGQTLSGLQATGYGINQALQGNQQPLQQAFQQIGDAWSQPFTNPFQDTVKGDTFTPTVDALAKGDFGKAAGELVAALGNIGKQEFATLSPEEQLAASFAFDPLNFIPGMGIGKLEKASKLEELTKGVGRIEDAADLLPKGLFGKIGTPIAKVTDVVKSGLQNVMLRTSYLDNADDYFNTLRAFETAGKDAKGFEQIIKTYAGLSSVPAQRAERLIQGFGTHVNEVENAFRTIQAGGDATKLPKTFARFAEDVAKGTAKREDLLEVVKAEMSVRLQDFMAQSAKSIFPVKNPAAPINIANRFLNNLKAAEALVYIGWSPITFVRNIVNGFTTMAIEGVSPLFSASREIERLRKLGQVDKALDLQRAVKFQEQMMKTSGAVRKAFGMGGDVGTNLTGNFGSFMSRMMQGTPIGLPLKWYQNIENGMRAKVWTQTYYRAMLHNWEVGKWIPPMDAATLAVLHQYRIDENVIYNIVKEAGGDQQKLFRGLQDLVNGKRGAAIDWDSVAQEMGVSARDLKNLVDEHDIAKANDIAREIAARVAGGEKQAAVANDVVAQAAKETADATAAKTGYTVTLGKDTQVERLSENIAEVERRQAALFVKGKVPKASRAEFDSLEAQRNLFLDERRTLQEQLDYTDEEMLFGKTAEAQTPPTDTTPPEAPAASVEPKPPEPPPGAPPTAQTLIDSASTVPADESALYNTFVGLNGRKSVSYNELKRYNILQSGKATPDELARYLEQKGVTVTDLPSAPPVAEAAPITPAEVTPPPAVAQAPAFTVDTVRARAAQLKAPTLKPDLMREWNALRHEGEAENIQRATQRAINKMSPDVYLEKARGWIAEGRAKGQTWMDTYADMFEDQAHFILNEVKNGNAKYSTPYYAERLANGDALTKLLRGGDNGFDWAKLDEPFDNRGFETFSQYRKRVGAGPRPAGAGAERASVGAEGGSAGRGAATGAPTGAGGGAGDVGKTYTIKEGKYLAKGKYGAFDSEGKMLGNYQATPELADAEARATLARQTRLADVGSQEVARKVAILSDPNPTSVEDAKALLGYREVKVERAGEWLASEIGGTKKQAQEFFRQNVEFRLNANGDRVAYAEDLIDAAKRNPKLAQKYSTRVVKPAPVADVAPVDVSTKWTRLAEERAAKMQSAVKTPRGEYPPALSQNVADAATELKFELNSGEAGKRHHYTNLDEGINQAMAIGTSNPDWYRELYAEYRVNKPAALKALDKIIADMGKDKGINVERMKEVILKRLAAGLDTPVGRMPADEEARALLGMKPRAAPEGQGRMFTAGEDSPLFSGTPARAQESAFVPEEAAGTQGKMFSTAPEFGVKKKKPTGFTRTTTEIPFGPRASDQVIIDEMVKQDNALREIERLRNIAKEDEAATAIHSADEMVKAKARTQADLYEALLNFYNKNEVKTYQIGTDLSTRLMGWARRDVVNAQNDARAAATVAADWMDNAVMISRDRETVFDAAVSSIVPFQFWRSRFALQSLRRVADQPARLAWYLHLRDMQDSVHNDPRFPKRLRGMLELPMSFIPQWAGGSMFFDPLEWGTNVKSVFGLNQFDDSVTDSDVAQAIRALAERGAIDRTEAANVIANQSGALWDQTKQRMMELSQSTAGGDVFSDLFRPHAPLDIIWKIKTGNADQVGVLFPMTRLIRAATGVNIEAPLKQGLRNLTGNQQIPDWDAWEQYRTDRALADMVGNGEITERDAMLALIEKRGQYYDLAKQRAQEQMSMQTFSVFGGQLFPKGEREYYKARSERDALLDQQVANLGANPQDLSNGEKWDLVRANGLTKKGTPLGDFGIANPVLAARSDVYAEPEARMKGFLTDEMWTRYNSLSALDKRAARNGNDELAKFIANPQRDYAAVTIDQMGAWVKYLRGYLPESEQTPKLGNLPQIGYATPDQSARYQHILDLQKQYFDLDKMQPKLDTYGKLSANDKRAYRSVNPDVDAYLKWYAAQMKANPDLSAIINPDFQRTQYALDTRATTNRVTRQLTSNLSYMARKIGDDYARRYNPRGGGGGGAPTQPLSIDQLSPRAQGELKRRFADPTFYFSKASYGEIYALYRKYRNGAQSFAAWLQWWKQQLGMQ